MSYSDFPKIQMSQVLDTADKLSVGDFQFDKNGELANVTLNLAHVGTVAGTTKVKMGLHLNSDFSVAFALSNEFLLTEINALLPGTPTGDWVAYVRFDFSRPNINKNQVYFFSLQTSGYTRDADTTYLAVIKDEPNDRYTLAGSTYGANRPGAMTAFTFQEPS